MAEDDRFPPAPDILDLHHSLSFDELLALLEGSLEVLVGNRTASLTSREYAARVDLAGRIYARLSPLCARFMSLAHGQPVDHLPASVIRAHPLNCSARLLKARPIASLEEPRRQRLTLLLEQTLGLGLLEHLVLWHYAAREHLERVQLEALYQHWLLESQDADEMMEAINSRGVLPVEAIFKEHWHSRLRPTLERDFVFGFWGIRRCRGYFRKLFYAGALLGMSFDLAAAESG